MSTTKLKIGQPVRGTSNKGTHREGRFAGRKTDGLRGVWLEINVAPKGEKAKVFKYRESQVTAL